MKRGLGIAICLLLGVWTATTSARQEARSPARLLGPGRSGLVSSVPAAASSADTASGELTGREFWQMLNEALRPPTEDQYKDVVQFFREHTPHRYEAYERFPDGRPAKRAILDVMIRRYNQLQRTKRQDPELYELLVKRINLQDAAISMVDSDAIAQKDFRSKVQELVTTSLDERQHRIDALEKSLAEQKAQLDKDKANIDALIDTNIKQLTDDSKAYKHRLEALRNASRSNARSSNQVEDNR